MIDKPGTVAVTTGHVGRYTEFHYCLTQLQMPEGSKMDWKYGINVALNANNVIRNMYETRPECEWVWFIDDDHVFSPDVLLRLLSHDADIVCPLVLRRATPFVPVAFTEKEDGYKCVGWQPFIEGRGLVEVPTYGKAGMLVRRSVFDKLDEPWFEMGRTGAEVGGMDLHFCHKARLAGYRILVDSDTAIGHLTHMAVWPVRTKEGWSIELRVPQDIGGNETMDVSPGSPELNGQVAADVTEVAYP